MAIGRARIGTSGWQYADWRGRFYPAGLPTGRWLEHYAQRFDTVEVNNTFYKLPARRVFERWARAVGDDFCFALKLSRFATHYKVLRDPEQPLALFLECAAPLGEKLGPILVQLPPRWKRDVPRLDAFLAAAPRRLRWAVELREPSWLTDEVFACLRDHGAALCVHDLLERHPRVVTADFVYLRFHGTEAKYTGGYSVQHLAARAREIRRDLKRGLDVHAYFNNDRAGHALVDAHNLLRFVERRSPTSRVAGRR